MKVIATWDNDGLKVSVAVPLGVWTYLDPVTGLVETVTWPAATLADKTITARIGKIAADGTVTGVQSATVSTSEAAPTAVDLAAMPLDGKAAQSGTLVGVITGLWSAGSVPFGKGQTAQFVVTISGDKPYTILSRQVDVAASL